MNLPRKPEGRTSNRETETAKWSRNYKAALRRHLRKGPAADIRSAAHQGRQAVVCGLNTLAVAKVHEQAVRALVLPSDSSQIEQANQFFIETLVPIEKNHHVGRKADLRVKELTQKLSQRTKEASASVRQLERGMALRQKSEAALKKSGLQTSHLLQESRNQQRRLRYRMRKLLSLQEDQRYQDSRQLHDEIAQVLVAIHLRLVTLKAANQTNAENIKKEIAETRELVKQSKKVIARLTHEFDTSKK